jgi:hypothetical protein
MDTRDISLEPTLLIARDVDELQAQRPASAPTNNGRVNVHGWSIAKIKAHRQESPRFDDRLGSFQPAPAETEVRQDSYSLPVAGKGERTVQRKAGVLPSFLHYGTGLILPVEGRRRYGGLEGKRDSRLHGLNRGGLDMPTLVVLLSHSLFFGRSTGYTDLGGTVEPFCST